MTSLATQATRGALATLGGQWGRFVVQLASLMVLARLLAPSDYGILSMVMAVAGLAYVVGDFGLSMAAIQAKSLTKGQASNLFWLNTLLGLGLGAGVYASAGPLASFYDHPDLQQVAQVVSIVFVISGATAQFRAETTRKLMFKGMALTDILSQVIALGVAVSIALLGGGYWALVAQQVTQALVTLVALIIVARWMPGWPDKAASVRGMLKFGANTSGVQIINYASSNADSLLIGRNFGAEALGIYDRAFQLFRMPLQQIAAPMTRVALPVLSRIQDDDVVYNRYIRQAQMILAYALGGIFFFAIATAEPVLLMALGEGWGDATSVFRILAVGGVFQCLGYVYYWIFLSRALTGLQLRYTIFTKIAMICFMVVGSTHSPLGVAVGVAAGLFFHWLVLTIFAVPRANVKTWPLVAITLRPILLYGIMMLPAYYVSLLCAEFVPIAQVGMILAVCMCYLALTLLIPPVRSDMKQINRVIRLALKQNRTSPKDEENAA